MIPISNPNNPYPVQFQITLPIDYAILNLLSNLLFIDDESSVRESLQGAAAHENITFMAHK